MVESLLYYRKCGKSLTDIEFEINPYDPRVANKMIEDEEMYAFMWMTANSATKRQKSWIG